LSGAAVDAIADPQTGLDGQAVSDGPLTAPLAVGPEAGEGRSPFLTLNGFTGPLDRLLALARAQKIDLFDISLTALLDQLTAALRQAPAVTSLGEKGDWVVMTAWLVQLRTRLLLPPDAPGQQEATAEADQLRGRLVALEEIQALAFWLEQRPQLGRDVFARGRPEIFGVSVEAGLAIDVIEFLWASLMLFDDAALPDTTMAYRPAPLVLHTVVEARERILRRLQEQPEGVALDQLLPDEAPDAGAPSRRARLQRSGWAATFVAGFEPIHVAPAHDLSPP
jgi:segregation and condensation protein A